MRVQIVGRGRMAQALEACFGRADGIDLLPLAGRGADGRGPDGRPVDAVLLAVPDAAIADAAAGIAPGPLVGHLSGATPVSVLAPHEGFGLHPLQTVTGAGTSFAGGYAAVDGTTPRALEMSHRLAAALGLRPFAVRDRDRPAYHAAASVASNYLLALEHLAEGLAATAGVPREALLPLVRETVENWGRLGASAALTGPVARGDETTVARQRAAVEARLPRELPLFDALTAATRSLAAAGRDPEPHPTPRTH